MPMSLLVILDFSSLEERNVGNFQYENKNVEVGRPNWAYA